jgi:hypothetical protein
MTRYSPRNILAALTASSCVLAFGCGAEPATAADIENADTSAYDPEIVSEPLGINDKACVVTRTDYNSSITIGDGGWGDWDPNCFEFCPMGSFAYAANLKAEGSQLGNDDTALNAVSLHCYDRTGLGFTGYVESLMGAYGTWRATGTTNPYTLANPFVGGSMKIEGAQGSGDDTSANQVRLEDKDGGNLTVLATGTTYGTWRNHVVCPPNTAVCGIRTKLESNQGGGDDTMLNGVALACCNF